MFYFHFTNILRALSGHGIMLLHGDVEIRENVMFFFEDSVLFGNRWGLQ